MYVDGPISGINIVNVMPEKPKTGDCFFDSRLQMMFVYTGTTWEQISGMSGKSELPRNLFPTKEELEAHPSLKAAWEEYLIVKRLLGL